MIQCRGADGRGELESIESFEFKSVHFFYPARPEVGVEGGKSMHDRCCDYYGMLIGEVEPNEPWKIPWLVGLFRGLYYPLLSGWLYPIMGIPINQPV